MDIGENRRKGLEKAKDSLGYLAQNLTQANFQSKRKDER